MRMTRIIKINHNDRDKRHIYSCHSCTLFKNYSHHAGMTLIDVVVGTALMLIVFVSVTATFRLAISLIDVAREETSALALLNQNIEALRALPYYSLGTVGGIPSGSTAQVSTTTFNGIAFVVRTLIKYVDDPADGTGAADTNAITADYKVARVEADWSDRGITHSLVLSSNFAPTGIEQLGSGGTLTVNVINSLSQVLSGATVRVYNASTSPAIDVTALSNTAGVVSFPGTPPASNYQITVSKSGDSTAQTYSATGSNPNPSPAHLSVINAQTTSSTFAIDTLASLHIYTYAPIAGASWTDDFTDLTKLALHPNTTVSGGNLVLSTSGGSYVSSGSAQSVAVTPQYLATWNKVTWSAATPANTTATYQVMYDQGGGSYVLVPDSALAGNSSGLSSTSLNIAPLSVTTYQSLKLSAALTTSNGSSTPSVDAWGITYNAGPTPLANVGFTTRGAKIIGTTAGGTSLYKYNANATTTQYGDWLLTPMEWDSYTLTPTGAYDASEICPFSPVSLLPGAATNVSITVVANTSNTLLVYVQGGGAALTGATITLVKSGTTYNAQSSSCGQAFFPGLASGTYTLTITKTGYTNYSASVSVNGDVRQTVTMQ